MSSPAFKALLAHSATTTAEPTYLPLLEDDGDTMSFLCSILHLRNDLLPARLSPVAFYKLALLSSQYQCTVATGRATHLWFQHHFGNNIASETLTMIEIALLLDEPIYFARFTERYVLSEAPAHPVLMNMLNARMHDVFVALASSRQTARATVRIEVDLMVDPCSVAFADSHRHYYDQPPGETSSGGDPRKMDLLCRVDEQASVEFLGALRDEKIWPATVWPSSIGALVDIVREFSTPEYDDCDKCAYCAGVKDLFEAAVARIKKQQAERLWGLCLDCFKAGGLNAGRCRYEHVKPMLLV